jgi:hypothetical protein
MLKCGLRKQYIYKYNQSLSFGLLFVGFNAFVLHLFEQDLFDLESQFFEQSGENLLKVYDAIGVGLVKVHPNLDSETYFIRVFRRNKSESIHVVTPFKGTSDQEECDPLIEFFLVGLVLWNLKDKATALLILRVLPFWLYS